MADLFSHSTRVNKSIAPEYGKYCCGYVSAVGGTHRTAQRGPPSLPASSAHRKDVKDRTDRPPSIPVYSYLPRLFVTLCSPLVSQLRAIQALNPYQVSPRQVAHELRSFLQTARASIFSARIIQEHVTRQLTEQQRPPWEYTTSLLTVADSASKASTTSTSRSTNVAVVLRFLPITTGDVKDPPVSMDSAELGRLAESEVRVPVALCASFLAASAYTSLGDALLFLRKVLPNEVEIESRTIGACPADTARAAAEFLLDELKLLAVGLRLKAEQRGASTADAELVQVCSNLRVPTSIARRILRSHIRADLAIASL